MYAQRHKDIVQLFVVAKYAILNVLNISRTDVL